MVAGAGHQWVRSHKHMSANPAHAISSFDGQCITAKKDYQEAKKRYKEQARAGTADAPSNSPLTSKDVKNSAKGTHDEDMDAIYALYFVSTWGRVLLRCRSRKVSRINIVYEIYSMLILWPADKVSNGWRAKSMAGYSVSMLVITYALIH